jgi:hypothetical protein
MLAYYPCTILVNPLIYQATPHLLYFGMLTLSQADLFMLSTSPQLHLKTLYSHSGTVTLYVGLLSLYYHGGSSHLSNNFSFVLLWCVLYISSRHLHALTRLNLFLVDPSMKQTIFVFIYLLHYHKISIYKEYQAPVVYVLSSHRTLHSYIYYLFLGGIWQQA